MGLSLVADLNEEPCPVTETLLGELHRSSPPDAVEIAKGLPERQRASLAAFCYNKRHLYALALMIASTCGRATLVAAGGNVGEMIFRQSRDPDKTLAAEQQPLGSRPPKPISLAQPNFEHADTV